MKTLTCKYCDDAVEVDERAVAVTCAYCVATVLLSDSITTDDSAEDENNSKQFLVYMYKTM